MHRVAKVFVGFLIVAGIAVFSYAAITNVYTNKRSASIDNTKTIDSSTTKPSQTPKPTPVEQTIYDKNLSLARSTSRSYFSPSPTPSPTSSSSSSGSSSSGSNGIDPCGDLQNSTYDNIVLADSPISYFPLNVLNNICDHGSNHYQAYSNGNIASTTLPNGEHAIDFDGRTGYITVPDADGLSIPSTGKLTIEAWMRPDTLQFTNQEGSGYVHWMGKGEAGKYEYVSRMYSYTNSENRPNRISGYAFNATGGLGVGSYFQDALTAGNWIHYVIVINTVDTTASYPMGYTKIYKNGVQRDKDNLASLNIIPGNGTAPFRIATRDLNSFFEGAIGKVAIYNYELSPFQIQEHYQTIVPAVAGTATFIGTVGQASTKTAGTTLQITVNQAVPVGDTLIARVVADYSAAGPTMTDSKGNTYTRDRTAPNSGNTIRASIFSAPITNALAPGDTITLTTASVAARALAIDQFHGLYTSGLLDQANGTSGNSTTPGTTISITTTQANSLVIGMVGVEGPLEDVFEQDMLGQFSSPNREGTDSDADDTNVTINGAYKSVSETGNYQFRPTIDPARNWVLFILNYKAL